MSNKKMSKEEILNSIQKKKRIIKKAKAIKQQKEKNEKHNKLLLPNIKNNIVVWEHDGHGNFIGSFKNKKYFKIQRGILLFSLKITDKKLLSILKTNKINKNFNSHLVVNIQEYANKILKTSISRYSYPS